jgi:hypothetical protein
VDERTYNDLLIIEYLLGSLGEEETERFDELSITDDEFAHRLRAVENDLVDSYARGELSGQRLERFESFYLASPVRREKVSFAKAFHSVASPTVLLDRQKRAVREPRRRFFASPMLQWGLAAAASLFLATGIWLAFENLRIRERVNQAELERAALSERERELQEELVERQSTVSEKEKEVASLRERVARLEESARETKPRSLDQLSVFPFTLSPQSRGVSQMPALSIPPRTDYLALQLRLEPGDHLFYRAELKSLADGKVVWRSARLSALAGNEGRALVVAFRSALLKSQRYILEVYADGSSEAVASYPFGIIKQ